MKGIAEFCTPEDVAAVLETARKIRNRRAQMRRRWIEPGSYSAGTLRPEDLIPAMLDAGENVRMSRTDRNTLRKLRADWERNPDPETFDPDGYTENETLPDILSAYTPPGHYWGSHPGDGADIGCWPSEDVPAVEDPTPENLDRADRTGPGGVVFEVSDHGNILGVWERSCTGDAKLDRWRRISL